MNNISRNPNPSPWGKDDAKNDILLEWYETGFLTRGIAQQVGYDRNRIIRPEPEPEFRFRLAGTGSRFSNSGSGLKNRNKHIEIPVPV